VPEAVDLGLGIRTDYPRLAHENRGLAHELAWFLCVFHFKACCCWDKFWKVRSIYRYFRVSAMIVV
jgi:hypothetical protein